MPVNRNALIRYRTIDQCLQNRYRQWTLEDLQEACSEALYEYEGIDKGVSRRTVQMDLQMMRSEKLGYHAPIIVVDRKYYTYENPDYSITNIPLTDKDLEKLAEVAEILRQFKGFSHFKDLGGMVQRLEDKIKTARTRQLPVIDLEKNEHLRGLEHLDTVYNAIARKHTLLLTYQSFKARQPSSFTFHPYLLKEWRNRWFVLGIKMEGQPLLTLALDRIEALAPSDENYIPYAGPELSRYFDDIIGITENANDPVEEVRLFFDRQAAPYVLTKPLHHSQELENELPDGVIVCMRVKINMELEKEILSFGDAVRVLAPERLKRRIRQAANAMAAQYEQEEVLMEIPGLMKRLKRRGYAICDPFYTHKEVGRMVQCLEKYLHTGEENPPRHGIRHLLQKAPALKEVIFNENLRQLVTKGMGPGYFLTKAVFFDKPPQANWYVQWHQDKTINLQEKISVKGFTGWAKKEGMYSALPPVAFLHKTVTVRIHLDDTDKENGALRIISKSHQQIFSDAAIKQRLEEQPAKTIRVKRGGIHLMKPLLLHASGKNEMNKPRRVIHLEFCNMELPLGLVWAEKESIF